MFTGIIEKTGTVSLISPGSVYKLGIDAGEGALGAAIGDSVSVNGVCLTVTDIRGRLLCFDAVRETVGKTTLSYLKTGDRVNLETALTLSKPVGGHFVSGHVDGQGTVARVRQIADSAEIDFACPGEMLRYIAAKGSVAIDGISLTVASVSEAGFTVAVIPHTLTATTLRARKPGDRVNIETDILAKYVERLTVKRDSLADTLQKEGFM